MPEVHWNGDDIAVLNGSINGSCIATGNPCPEAKVIIPNPATIKPSLSSLTVTLLEWSLR